VSQFPDHLKARKVIFVAFSNPLIAHNVFFENQSFRQIFDVQNGTEQQKFDVKFDLIFLTHTRNLVFFFVHEKCNNNFELFFPASAKSCDEEKFHKSINFFNLEYISLSL
jgi:hypothetical protein